MFKRYHGGEEVARGKYWNLYSGDYIVIGEEGGVLPPAEGEYVRGHPLLVLFAGPLLGLAYMMFLPIAVPILMAQFVARKVRSGAAALGRVVPGR